MPKHIPLSFRIGGALVGMVVSVALLSLLWLPQDPNTPDFLRRLAPPSPGHPLGTDHLGRDLLARVMAGAQNALYVGLISVGIGMVLGTTLGLLGGYLGGALDRVLGFLLEAFYALPPLLLAILFAAILNPGATSSMLAIGLATVPAFYRLSRAGVLVARAQAYVEAAIALGANPLRIMLHHILPQITGPLLVQGSLAFAAAILIEAALSYLGLGTQPPTASWGRMLREAQGFLFLSPWPAVWPGLCIAVTVMGFNLLGDGLRDLLDPRAKINRSYAVG